MAVGCTRQGLPVRRIAQLAHAPGWLKSFAPILPLHYHRVRTRDTSKARLQSAGSIAAREPGHIPWKKDMCGLHASLLPGTPV